LSLFPKEDILTKEIESWKGFADSLHSDNRELFMNMLNECYKYAAAINAKGEPFPAEPLIMALLLSQHKMIDWLTKQISKNESLASNKEVKESKQQQEQDLGKESTNDYIRKNERIHYIDDDY
jgi:hypothetical protein